MSARLPVARSARAPSRGRARHRLDRWLAIAPIVLVLGCATAEDVFVDGRIENLCVRALPACGGPARCELTNDRYLRSRFPGGERIVVHTLSEATRLRVRMLLIDRRYPGTELLVRGYDTGCRDFDEVLFRDLDLFALAGRDGVIEVELLVHGRGDHPVEVFSDLASEYLLTIDVLEQP